MTNALTVIRSDIDGVAQRFEQVRVDKSLSFAAEAGFAMQTLAANEYALGVAMKNRQSVINAVQNIAAIGISLNPARRQAYLVPRDGRICLDISYMGLMDLAMQSGAIKWAQCALVYAADEFALNGLDKQPMHKCNPFAKDRGEIVGVYATVKTSDGDFLTHCMSIDEVNAIRDRSSAWKAWIEKKRKCPWVTDQGEMVRKTCIKQAFKYWPKGERFGQLEAAVQYLNTEAGEGIELNEPQAKSLAIPATVGAMERMPIDVQNILREVAELAKNAYENDGVGHAFDILKDADLGPDETVAIWTLIPSDMRSALKAEGKARAEAVKAISNEQPA
jgi:recombination protein RecT